VCGTELHEGQRTKNAYAAVRRQGTSEQGEMARVARVMPPVATSTQSAQRWPLETE